MRDIIYQCEAQSQLSVYYSPYAGGSQHNDWVRMKGKGVKDPNRPNSRGDMYVHFHVEVPKPADMTEGEREAMEALLKELQKRGQTK